MRRMRRSPGVLLLSAALLAAPAATTAQDEPKKPAAAEPAAPAEPFLQVDKVDVETPPCRIERPSDSWLFLDLEVMRRQAIEQKQDVSGYATLKARLYHGRTRSNIFVKAEADVVHRAEPPKAADLAKPMADGLVAALTDGKLEQQGAARVGAREGWLFEVRGKPKDPPNAAPVVIVRAVVYRPEDHQIFTITLEGPAEKAADLRKDLLKLLKKVKL
jgi:hypothetical protein